MRLTMYSVGLLPLFIMTVCQTASRESRSAGEFAVSDIGRNAAITTLSGLHVQQLIREGKSDEALGFLDSTYLHQLTLLRLFDFELAGDQRFLKLRNRIVETLQREWLQSPPRYLDGPSAEYLERVCATIPQCSPGRVKGLEPLPDVQLEE